MDSSTAAPRRSSISPQQTSFTSGWPRHAADGRGRHTGTEPKEPGTYARVSTPPRRHSRLYVPDHAFGPGSSGDGCAPPTSLSVDDGDHWNRNDLRTPSSTVLLRGSQTVVRASRKSLKKMVHIKDSLSRYLALRHQVSSKDFELPSLRSSKIISSLPLVPRSQEWSTDPGYSCRKLRRILPKTTSLGHLQLLTGIQLSHHRFFLPISALNCGLNANFLPSGS